MQLQRGQYQTIIDRMNQFKNKMQEYHLQFQHNAKQIQSLKEENNSLKKETKTMGKRTENGSKSVRAKGFSVMMCLLLIVAVLYFYNIPLHYSLP